MCFSFQYIILILTLEFTFQSCLSFVENITQLNTFNKNKCLRLKQNSLCCNRITATFYASFLAGFSFRDNNLSGCYKYAYHIRVSVEMRAGVRGPEFDELYEP